MKKIRVKLADNGYEIIIGKNILKSLPRELNRILRIKNVVIITNPTIKRIYAGQVNRILKKAKFSFGYLTIPDTETSKSLKYFTSCIFKIARLTRNKPFFIIALGGGVVGDLAGFIAAVYKRGVPYVQVPTTLLAQVDSAIGGKTAVDLAEAKNLVGAFYQPALVLSDTKFLKSLSKRQIKSGLAEVIKYSIIMDKDLFGFLDKNYKKILKINEKALEHIIYYSSLHKAKIIEKDEKEAKGLRTILNFGHTVGHAIEAASGYKRFSHGEAISVGMVAASYISWRLNLINKSTLKKIVGLLSTVDLPIRAKKIKATLVMKSLAFDKKFIRGKNRLVLIKGIGKVVIKENINPKLIKEAIEYVLV